MQELNNHQIVLLTMFVSFVVSIATGIITVAMLEEAPPTLTQTVNRVVEHTIERVVTGTTTPTVDKPAVVTNITKEVTVYTKEDDLVVAAVEKNQSRTVKIFLSDADTSSTPRSIGFVVSRDGLIVAETEDLLAGGAPADTYTVVIGEKHYTAKLVTPKSATDEPISFLKLSGMTATTSLDAVSFGRNDSPKLGQTIIVLGGADGSSVFKTTISKFRAVKSVGTSTPERAGAEVETTPAIPAHNAGALVVNLDGQAVGVVVSDPNDPGSFLICPSSCILALINLFSAPTP